MQLQYHFTSGDGVVQLKIKLHSAEGVFYSERTRAGCSYVNEQQTERTCSSVSVPDVCLFSALQVS